MKEYFLQCSDALRSKLLVQVTDTQMFILSLGNMPENIMTVGREMLSEQVVS